MKYPGDITFRLRLGGKEICSVGLTRFEYETIRRFGFRDAIERVVQRGVQCDLTQEGTPGSTDQNNPAAQESSRLDPVAYSMHLRQFLIELHQGKYRVTKKGKDEGP